MNAPALDVKKAWVSREITHDLQLFRAQFSHDGKFIAAGEQDKLVHVWELEGEKKKTLNAHKTWVSSLTFHPKAKRLFTADYLGVIHCWNHEAGGKPLWTIPEADRDNVRALVVTPDGKHLISAGDDAVIKVWNTATDERQTISAHTGFNAPPTLYSGVVCWEYRSTADIDIRCSDGMKLSREGHQTHPFRYDGTLFFREDGLLWVWEPDQ